MSSQISFNRVKIGTVDIVPEQFVTGTGVYTINGFDKTLNTADGEVHHFRLARRKKVAFQCYGDFRFLISKVGAGETVELYYNDTFIDRFQALISMEVDYDPVICRISANGSPEF